ISVSPPQTLGGIQKIFLLGMRTLGKYVIVVIKGCDMATRLLATNDCAHVTGTDFCHIFQEEMQSLYSLALILTKDHSLAEECFVTGLEDCLNAHSIFKEWALSWSKRVVIKNAIRLISPEQDGEASPTPDGLGLKTRSALADALIGLEQFQRFVIVMSVLERYSDKECALLLNCGSQDGGTARNEGLRTLARSGGQRLTAAVFRNEFELATAVPLPSVSEAVTNFR